VWAVAPVAIVMVMVYFGVSMLVGIGEDERWAARSLFRSSDTIPA